MKLGKKHLELAIKWTPTLATYGAASGLAALYVVDWKLVLQYVPYYGGKFKE